MRTTLDIDAPILKELRKIAKRRGVSMGRAVSEILGRALREEQDDGQRPEFVWRSAPLGAPFDYADKEAVYRALENEAAVEVRDKRRR